MTPRHVVLAIAAVAVLGMGVYLFVQVRATPARAETPPVARPTSPPQPVAARPEPAGHGAPAHTQPTQPTQPTVAETPSSPDDQKANPHLDATMDQANKAYDHQDYDEAKAIAGKVLAAQPDNIRMMRIMVSSSCIDGDMAVAQTYYDKLPKLDREQMKARCDRYGAAFKEPPQ